MSYKILEQNGVENENIDGGAFNNFAAGGLDGILRGVLSECKLVAEGNVLNISPGVLLLHGFRVKIFESESISITSIPVAATRYQIVAQIVYSESSVAFSMFIQEPIELVKQNFFETGNGKYQIEIGRFTHNTDGSIGDLQRTADIISGGSGGGTGSIKVGNVETSMLEEGLPVEVDIDKRVENGVTILDFKFAFPKASAGSDFDPNGTYDSLTAGKAKKDENGNSIPETYATKAEVQAKYTKPSSGIPESDLAQAVKDKLNDSGTTVEFATVDECAEAFNPTLMTFQIMSVTYNAKINMIWRDWVSSDYNTAGFTISGSNVKFSTGKYVYDEAGMVSADAIIQDKNYSNDPGGSGGSTG